MRSLAFIFLVSVSLSASAQSAYDKYFTDKALRIDFALSGNINFQSAALIQLREEPTWGGPRKNLIDPFNYGGYLMFAYSAKDGQLVYSRGFNTLFEEWRTTDAAQHETQSWTNSIVMPFPRDSVRLVLLGRNRETNNNDTLMALDIDPSSIFIDRGRLHDNPAKDLQIKGLPAEKVDFVFLAEGYKSDELEKFFADADSLAEALFKTPPYDQRREDFNIRAVFVESADAGTDFSGKGIFKNTALNSGFYTFGLDRYLTTPDIKSIRDALWNTPCDAIFVIVNSEVYGGGGIYNYYAIGTADNERTKNVFVHELGHSFAGLADEYFTSDVAYNEFYNPDYEPWEPNITTLKDFASKWKAMLPASTPVPTPLEEPYADKLGVFEGGGYVSKGVFRPMDHCMMRDYHPFCPVCTKSILQIIDYLSDK